MSKTVKVVVKNGQVKMEYSGFKGTECDRLADKLRIEGQVTENIERKPEYYVENTLSQTEAQQ